MILNSDLNDYFAILITIVAALNGIGIPLSYNIISENLKPFSDKNISKAFLNEKHFKRNIIVAIWSLPVFAFPLFVDIKHLFDVGKDNQISIAFTNFYLVLSFFWIAGFLISFIEFSLLIYEYASNTEEVVFEKIKEQIDSYLHE
jgi:hypothetical protein